MVEPVRTSVGGPSSEMIVVDLKLKPARKDWAGSTVELPQLAPTGLFFQRNS